MGRQIPAGTKFALVSRLDPNPDPQKNECNSETQHTKYKKYELGKGGGP
jgi:hypothetical protein